MSAAVEGFLFDSIVRHYGTLRGGRKKLARHAKVSVATADLWLSGKRTPNGAKLIALMAECQALREEVMQFASGERPDDIGGDRHGRLVSVALADEADPQRG